MGNSPPAPNVPIPALPSRGGHHPRGSVRTANLAVNAQPRNRHAYYFFGQYTPRQGTYRFKSSPGRHKAMRIFALAPPFFKADVLGRIDKACQNTLPGSRRNT